MHIFQPFQYPFLYTALPRNTGLAVREALDSSGAAFSVSDRAANREAACGAVSQKRIVFAEQLARVMNVALGYALPALSTRQIGE